MNLHNSYWYFKSALTPEQCQKILDLGLSKIKEIEDSGQLAYGHTSGGKEKQSMPSAIPQGESTVQDMIQTGNIQEKDLYVRDSKIAWLSDQWLYDLIMPYVNSANIQSGWNWQLQGAEPFQFTQYTPGGFYSWHQDGGSDHHAKSKRYIFGVTKEPLMPNGRLPSGYVIEDGMVGKVRKISLTINLNSPGEYEGGNLKFDFGKHNSKGEYHECEEIRPQGSIIIFPSFINHCVTPVTSGTRYSLVLWLLGNPFV